MLMRTTGTEMVKTLSWNTDITDSDSLSWTNISMKVKYGTSSKQLIMKWDTKIFSTLLTSWVWNTLAFSLSGTRLLRISLLMF